MHKPLCFLSIDQKHDYLNTQIEKRAKYSPVFGKIVGLEI